MCALIILIGSTEQIPNVSISEIYGACPYIYNI